MTQANQTPDFVELLKKRSTKSDAPVRDMLGDFAHSVGSVVNAIGQVAIGIDRELYTVNAVRLYECADNIEEAYYNHLDKQQDRMVRANARAIQVAQQLASLKAMNSQVEVSTQDLA